MDSIKKIYAFTIIVLLGLSSCNNDDFINKNENLDANQLEKSLPNTVQLDNPYTVDNMRIAYESLMQRKSASDYRDAIITSSSAIETTDYYVKFWVENSAQIEILEDRDSLMISVLPLDIEIIESEDSPYIEDDIEIDNGVWVYTSVPVDYNFPSDITHEKIEDLFLPEQSILDGEEEGGETIEIGRLGQISREFLEDLEDESLLLTGNWEEDDDEPNEPDDPLFKSSKKRPDGHLKVINTVTNAYEPVPGIRVRIRRWFKWGVARTNEQGFYVSNRRFRKSPRYTFNFKHSNGLRIWSKWINFSSAKHRAGKRNKRGYDLYLTTNRKAWRWATVSNAVLEYRDYCDQFGITKPDANLRIIARSGSLMGSSAPMLRRVYGNPGFDSNNQVRDFLMNMQIALPLNVVADILSFAKPDILIRIKLSNHDTFSVKRVVYHELGHASHFKQVGNDYWIKYINYILTYGAYGDGAGVNAGHCEIGEMWGYFIEARLIKEYYAFNSYSLNSPSSGSWIFPQIFKRLEEDAGYSIQQIFSCLKPNIDTVPKLKNELINTIGLNVNTVNNIFNDYGY